MELLYAQMILKQNKFLRVTMVTHGLHKYQWSPNLWSSETK